ncbi:hypothetical protein IWX90DRAFT_101131 [Phyllosticta citrichinensis]|uniref:Uncharacterized protein n=1 Tax=Phyllosticta citrichinensis TaxID=1130410 RepID=A0ABR1Y1U8_9PEZI
MVFLDVLLLPPAFSPRSTLSPLLTLACPIIISSLQMPNSFAFASGLNPVPVLCRGRKASGIKQTRPFLSLGDSLHLQKSSSCGFRCSIRPPSILYLQPLLSILFSMSILRVESGVTDSSGRPWSSCVSVVVLVVLLAIYKTRHPVSRIGSCWRLQRRHLHALQFCVACLLR